MIKIIPILLMLCACSVQSYCFESAGAKYQIDPRLLKAIAIRESGLNQKAINVNKDSEGKVLSTDYGLMQVNSTHIPKLISMGVVSGRDDLLNDACLNVHIGAWVLATHIQKCGVNWSCLGTYNAGFKDTETQEKRRIKYAKKIYGTYQELLTK